MKRLFDELSYKLSKVTTEKYSTSFSLGIKALHPSIRPAIYAIYGYVRLADEIVDSFHGYDKAGLLQRFRQQTCEALYEKISVNPILHAFQETVNAYKIDRSLIDRFLDSMEMDLAPVKYDAGLYNKYILGSAEVVGLMCLQVFVMGDCASYEALKPYAMKLGSAFQKVNFLRDFKADYQQLGRSYFPHIEMGIFNDTTKRQIEKEIEQEFEAALVGIRQLSEYARFGVLLAYRYYLSLFKKIKQTSAAKIMHERVRLPNGRKLSLMMSAYLQYKMSII
jgi:phytoene/squalene synthetase